MRLVQRVVADKSETGSTGAYLVQPTALAHVISTLDPNAARSLPYDGSMAGFDASMQDYFFQQNVADCRGFEESARQRKEDYLYALRQGANKGAKKGTF